jgi:hypothetical protein
MNLLLGSESIIRYPGLLNYQYPIMLSTGFCWYFHTFPTLQPQKTFEPTLIERRDVESRVQRVSPVGRQLHVPDL